MLPRLGSLRSHVRRSVLRHRRLLAFVLTAAAVASGLGAVRPAAPATAAVWVAAHDLPAGAVIGPGDVDAARLPPHDVPDGVVATPVGQTLAAPVRRGEPVTDVRLVGPALTLGDPGVVAAPVRFSDAAMAGLLRVGDHVQLLVTASATGRTSVVADDVVVLGLPAPDGQAGLTTQLTGRLVVLGVSPASIATVTSAAVTGFLTFAYDPPTLTGRGGAAPVP